MSLPLVYLDQNVISLQLPGNVDLSGIKSAQLVYSKEHFAEIRRANDPLPFLHTLDQLSARLLDIEMVNWEFTGRAVLKGADSAENYYQDYLDANEAVPVDSNLINPFLAWVCGGASAALLRELPGAFSSQLQRLLEQIPKQMAPEIPANMEEGFRDMIESMITSGNDIGDIREQLGVGKGAAGSITGDNPLGQLWEKVSPKVPGLTADQFFGFAPVVNGQTLPLTWQGIIGCCTVLDILGYQAEGKKTRNPEKIPNVLSDAAHIAAGAYCAAIVSHDSRLVKRAKAIYQFREIGTEAAYLEPGSQKRKEAL